MASFFFNDYKSTNWFAVDKNTTKMSTSLVLVSTKTLSWFVSLSCHDRSRRFSESASKKIE